MPLISIIMPVYNNEKYFPKAVYSVLHQDFDDFELIIVDDGSTDQTGEIADELATQDSRIKVIHQQNQWIYASFNRGVREAKGEYIYILNSDDRLRENVLGYLCERVKKYNPDVIWTKVLVHVCDSEQRILEYDISDRDAAVKTEKFFETKEEVRKAWPYFEESGLAHNQANLYRRELVINHPFRNDVYGADTLFNISIASDVNSALVVDLPVYDFFVYNHEKMNASVGKFYSYEHSMFNEIYNGYMNLFESWDLEDQSYKIFFSRRRMKQLTNVIRRLQHPQCNYTTDEKLELIFTKYMDETMKKCALILDAQEELESRLLSGARTILSEETLSEESKMFFIYELLESLLRYEKDEEDYRRIKNAINHPLNPYGVGRCFYVRLNKKSDYVNKVDNNYRT